MISDTELEQLFAERKTPEKGRRLIRDIRAHAPVRKQQGLMDQVRTRFISRKSNGAARYAESRTVELAAILRREGDPDTVEYHTQPYTFDWMPEGPKGGRSRLQHTPDIFAIDQGLVLEEWREEVRLLKLAAERPHHFTKDGDGRWHYLPMETLAETYGVEYRLHSADELPRRYLSNLRFLEDYSRDDVPLVPEDVRDRLLGILRQRNLLPHLSLVHEHHIKADHVFQMVLSGDLYVDLKEVALSNVDELVIHRSEAVYRAERILRAREEQALPSSALVLSVGAKFTYDGSPFEVVLPGKDNVIVRDGKGHTTTLSLDLVERLFQDAVIASAGQQALPQSRLEYDANALLASKGLDGAVRKLEAMSDPKASSASKRSLVRWKAKIAGVAAPQEQLLALMNKTGGNRSGRLPPDVEQEARRILDTFHNKKNAPTPFASFNKFVEACNTKLLKPMSKSSWYEFVKRHEDVKKREGGRKAYQVAPIPLTYDFGHSVHGVLPHEVCYCDHTILSMFLKGSVLGDLGKPTITLMQDGALSKPRAFFLSYQPASTITVLMCLRDYVRRHGRLPRILVLDNGKEFHSRELKLFCSLFGIEIRWRRRSSPRDSTKIERMLGVTEQEVIAQLDGNSLVLKDPRMVSSSHDPQKNIRWTLPALHGTLDNFLFDVQPGRVHPAFGITIDERERQLNLEYGSREHVVVRYDPVLRLLTAPHSGSPTRKVDPIRGVFVDGRFHWDDRFASAKKDELAEVRVEIFNARVVYVNFRNQWRIAQARDGGNLEGRTRPEVEQQKREEARVRRTLAAKDKTSVEQSRKRARLWIPENWDDRMRDQMAETLALYGRLGMAEALPEAACARTPSVTSRPKAAPSPARPRDFVAPVPPGTPDCPSQGIGAGREGASATDASTPPPMAPLTAEADDPDMPTVGALLRAGSDDGGAAASRPHEAPLPAEPMPAPAPEPAQTEIEEEDYF